MSKETRNFVTILALLGLVAVTSGTAQANWEDTFNNNTFDLSTWEFPIYPQLPTGNFSATIQDGPDDNDYLALVETNSIAVGGSGFGAAFVPSEQFTDVRVGAVVSVAGDACRNNYVLIGRAAYIIDDGTMSGYPGVIANCYCLIMYWADGPADLTFEVQKIIYNDHTDVMNTNFVAAPSGVGARSYYAELDIVGSDPTYVTGCLYEYKGGPLVAKTPTMVDTNAQDSWEEEREMNYPVFASGVSGVSAYNGDPEPAGYRCTFDDVFSASDGPAAVNLGPADGETGVSVNPTLSWVEGEFATGRELWIGKPHEMQKVAPAPAGTTYTVGPLEFGQTYQWRIDQVGASNTVTGHTWSFTTADCLAVEDFESYANDAGIRAAWVDNITDPGVEYVFLGTGENQSLRFEYQNQFEPYYTEATRTFSSPQDWTAQGVKAVALSFYGERDNVEQPMYLKLEDSASPSHAWKVENPYTHACQAERWEDWRIALSEFSDNGVNLSSIKKVTIGTGNGTKSAQSEADADKDFVFIDDIRLCPAQCLNVDQLDLRGDVNGDCKIDLNDLAVMAAGWLNDGSSAAP